MAKGKRKNKLSIPPFVPLTWDLLNSSAYKTLPHAAAKALPYFLGKPKIHPAKPERYEADFALSYPEATKLGFSKGTFAKVIRDLVRLGFIDPVRKGGLRGKSKACNMFRLSRRWEKYGSPQFQQLTWGEFV